MQKETPQTTEPLIGLQLDLDSVKLLLREGLPGHAALKLQKLAKTAKAAAELIGDAVLANFEAQMAADNEALDLLLQKGGVQG